MKDNTKVRRVEPKSLTLLQMSKRPHSSMAYVIPKLSKIEKSKPQIESMLNYESIESLKEIKIEGIS